MKNILLILALLPLGIVAQKNCVKIKYTTYEVEFDTVRCMPFSSSYLETAAELQQMTFERKNNFHIDPRVKCINYSNYGSRGKIYDRGHLTPAEDMRYSQKGESDCFSMLNMTPQLAGFNRGIWKEVETQTRNWTEKYDSMLIISGAIGDSTEIHIPKYCWKVIYSLKYHKGIAFILPNNASNDKIEKYELPIDKLNLNLPVHGNNIDKTFWKYE